MDTPDATGLFAVRRAARGIWRAARDDWRRMEKPRAIEDVGDTWLIRPLGFLLVQALRHTPITPNAVSLLSVVVAWASAWAFYRATVEGGAVAPAVVGVGLLLLYSALDSADGQLARLTGRFSEIGRVLDGVCDNLAFLAVYVAILAGYVGRGGEHPVLVTALGVAAVGSHSLQAAASEYQRMLYLHHVHDSTVVHDEEPARLRRREGRGRVERPGRVRWQQPLRRLFDLLQLRYAVVQRALCGSSHELWQRIEAARRQRQPEARAALEQRAAAAYRDQQRPMLPWWALLGSNAHKLGIAVAAFLPPLTPSGASPSPWWAGLGMAWFFLFDLALDVVLAALLAAQSRLDRRLAAAIAPQR